MKTNNVIIFFQLKEKERKRIIRRMRRIVSQPNLTTNTSKSNSRIKRNKSESKLVLKQKKEIPEYVKQTKEKIEPVIKYINTNILAKSIQDFEFAYQIKHSTNISSFINSFLLFSLFIYTIECNDEKKHRVSFILGCMIIFQLMNR